MTKNRLTKDSAGVTKLIEKYKKGENSGTADRKAVWMSDALFQRHKLAKFRIFYHHIRAKNCNSQSESPFHCFDKNVFTYTFIFQNFYRFFMLIVSQI